MAAFVRGMLDAFAGASPDRAPAAPRRESDRQLDAPLGWALGALRWSPKPSAVAVAGIGLAAAAQRALRDPAPQRRRARAAAR
jgi:protease I